MPLLAMLGVVTPCPAQSPAPAATGIQRELVTRADVSLPHREAVVARITVAPGVTAGRHSHPGEEISYVLEGEGELLIDGQAPRRVKAGEAFVIPAGVVHDARNEGGVPMRLIGTFVVEKGQPLVIPAPAEKAP